MMGDLGGLLAISAISLSSSLLHSGTCWASLLPPLVAGTFNKAGGQAVVSLERTLGSKDAAFLCHQVPEFIL